MEIEITQVSCANCNILFWLPSSMVSQLKECHNEFFCPHGHTNYYPAETDAEKYRKLYKEEQDRRIKAEERTKQQTTAALRKVRSRLHTKLTS